MLLKCYYHLHLLSENVIVDQDGVDEHYNLDIFEMTTSTNEPMKEVVNKEFYIFKKFQVNAKELQCPFELWETHESMFPIYLDSLPMKF